MRQPGKAAPKSIKLGFTNIDDSWVHLSWVAFGGALMTGVHLMATRFYWWPLHPLGMLLVPSWAIYNFWWSIFLGWMIKALILKYGGGTTFRRLRPAFLGLIIGDCLIGGVWIVVALIRDSKILSIMPV